MLITTQPEIEGSDANDSEYQSSDSYDDAQSGCSEMVGFVECSFEVMFQTQPSKTLQEKRK